MTKTQQPSEQHPNAWKYVVFVTFALASILLFNLVILFVCYASVSSWWGYRLGPLFFMFLPWLLAVVCLPLTLLGLLFRRTRKISAMFAMLLAVFVLSSAVALHIGNTIRMHGFRKLAVRSQPLVNAISRYETSNGKPPADLNVLIPKYLDSIPWTSMASYPEYEYEICTDNPNLCGGNVWMLKVQTGEGLNWDCFFYYPNHEYPAITPSGAVERVEDWAYLHE